MTACGCAHTASFYTWRPHWLRAHWSDNGSVRLEQLFFREDQAISSVCVRVPQQRVHVQKGFVFESLALQAQRVHKLKVTSLHARRAAQIPRL